MRWKGWRADLLWALVSTVVALVGTLVGPPGKDADAVLAIASGVTMVLVRRRPLIVVAVQALLFAVSGAVAPFTSAVIVVLLLWSLGVLAYTGSWRAIVAGAAITYLVFVWNLVPVPNPQPFEDVPPFTPDPLVQLLIDEEWLRRLIEKYAPTAGLSIQFGEWRGLAVAAGWAGVAVLTGAILFRFRDA